MPEPKPVRYHLKIFKNNGEVLSLTTKKKRRISYRIQAVKNSEVERYLLKVTYEPRTDNFGKKITPTNEGYYPTQKELRHAWQCFIEK